MSQIDSDRALPWQILGRDVRPATFFLAVNTVFMSISAIACNTVLSGSQEHILGAIGLVTGALLVLLLPRILPFAADTHVAAIVMGQDRWNAGVTIMQTADPDGWRSVVDASQLTRDNAEAIGR